MHLILLLTQLSKKSFQVFIGMDSLNGMFWKGAYSRPWIWRCRALKIHSLGRSYQKESTLRRLLLPLRRLSRHHCPSTPFMVICLVANSGHVNDHWSSKWHYWGLSCQDVNLCGPWIVSLAGLWQPFPDNGTFVSCSQQSAHTEENWRPCLLALRCPVQIPSHMAQSHWAVEVWLVRMEMC